MPRIAIVPTVPKGPHAGTVAALALDLTFVAADVANKQMAALAGKIILLAWNTDASSHNISLTSVADKFKRTGDVTNYAVGAGKIAAYVFDDAGGWSQADNSVYFEADNALVKFCVLKA